jgi:hypothetical protein
MRIEILIMIIIIYLGIILIEGDGALLKNTGLDDYDDTEK